MRVVIYILQWRRYKENILYYVLAFRGGNILITATLHKFQIKQEKVVGLISFCHSSICNTGQAKHGISHVCKVSTCLHKRSERCTFFALLEKRTEKCFLYPTMHTVNKKKEDRHFS